MVLPFNFSLYVSPLVKMSEKASPAHSRSSGGVPRDPSSTPHSRAPDYSADPSDSTAEMQIHETHAAGWSSYSFRSLFAAVRAADPSGLQQLSASAAHLP